ncbi:MAG: PqqD family protein [Oscillochloris sp.]|nr:PqqD family protein [Oscillochloris sp.]
MVISATGEQISSHMGEELVILSLKNGTYYGLDPVGSFIWGLLEQPRSLIDLCDAVTAEYEVSREQCEGDVHALIRDLADHGLVEIRDASTA